MSTYSRRGGRRFKGRRYARKTHRKRFVTRERRLAPPPQMHRFAKTGALYLSPSASTVHGSLSLDAPENRANLVKVNGSVGTTVRLAAEKDVEVAFILATPLSKEVSISNDALSNWNPFKSQQLDDTPASRGFNYIRLNRLAYANPAGAPDTVFNINRRMKRTTRRKLEASAVPQFVVYATGTGSVACSVDLGYQVIEVA